MRKQTDARVPYGLRHTAMPLSGIARIDRAVRTQPPEPCMQYRDRRDFIQILDSEGELKRVRVPVHPNLEMTEIRDRTLRAGGPAVLFEQPKGSDIPVAYWHPLIVNESLPSIYMTGSVAV